MLGKLSCVPCIGSEDTYPIKDTPTYGRSTSDCCPLDPAKVVHPSCSRRVFESEPRNPDSDQTGIEISRICCHSLHPISTANRYDP